MVLHKKATCAELPGNAEPLPRPRKDKGTRFALSGSLYSPSINTIIETGNEGMFGMQANRLGTAAFSLRSAVREEFDPADYSFVVKRRGGPSKPWRWEIYCACKAVPVERSPIFFGSMAEAAKAGKKALAHFLAK